MDIFVGSVLLDDKNRIFLIREEDKNQISKGKWNLPGGLVVEGESLTEAVARECEEETGYPAKVKFLVGCYLCRKGNNSWMYVVFSAKTAGARKQVSDKKVSSGKWFSKDVFLKLKNSDLVHPDMKVVYKKAIEKEVLGLDTVKLINYD